MITLIDAGTGETLGTITEAQLVFLQDNLEEESLLDRDYHLTPDTVDMLEDAGADEKLLKLLRRAIKEYEGRDVMWTRE